MNATTLKTQATKSPVTERNNIRMPQRGQCHLLWLALDAEPKSSDQQLIEAIGCRPAMVSIVRRMWSQFHADPAAVTAPKKTAPSKPVAVKKAPPAAAAPKPAKKKGTPAAETQA